MRDDEPPITLRVDEAKRCGAEIGTASAIESATTTASSSASPPRSSTHGATLFSTLWWSR